MHFMPIINIIHMNHHQHSPQEIKIYAENIPNYAQLGHGMLKQVESRKDIVSLLGLHWKLFYVYLGNEVCLFYSYTNISSFTLNFY